MLDFGDNNPAFWLELPPDIVAQVLARYPEMLTWSSHRGHNFPEHLLLWPGPFPGKHAVIEALLAANAQWTLRPDVLDEAIRSLALFQSAAQQDPFTDRLVYEPGEGRPTDPDATDAIASRFAISLRDAEPVVRSRRLQRMGRVLQLVPRAGGPFHAQLRRSLKKVGLLETAASYAADPKPALNVPQAPVPLRRPAPRAKYEARLIAGRPLEAAQQVWQLRMSNEAMAKMLGDLLRRRLGSARYLRRRGALKTRWQARSARKVEYVDFRKFLQALAISAPSEWISQAVLLPSLQYMMEEAMLEDDLDLFRALYPNRTPADVSHRLTRRSLKIARQFSLLDPGLVSQLARHPLPYPSRYADAARGPLRAHLTWEEEMAPAAPQLEVTAEVDMQEQLERRRGLKSPSARRWTPPPPRPS